MLPSDAGGSPAPISSDVAVDPGHIRDFARFLEDMAGEFTPAREALATRQHDAASRGAAGFVDFGRYPSSESARGRHANLVDAAAANAAHLHTRLTEIAGGAHELACRYTDLAELNAANSDDITAALAAGATQAKAQRPTGPVRAV